MRTFRTENMCIRILTQERQAQSEWKGVEEPQKTTTRQTNYDWYHGHGKDISRPINDTKIITLIMCLSHISPTSGDESNVTHQSMGRK